ncbi:hypothetical protein DID78_04330 [Candidatus Marinamargulisbacteria bacterium SCGC AG-343-D04]|nr:hypothetical protein DID78_04330 [Candidatus Marinamargulisbacteria bacterium SCGC AG-343-D04]
MGEVLTEGNKDFNPGIKTKINVKIYELNNIRSVPINLNNGKDRGKLKHILEHESYRLRKRDIERYKELLKRTKNR